MTEQELVRCELPDRLVVVDRPKALVRLRSWRIGRPAGAKPNLTIEQGKEEFGGGTSPCMGTVWTFASGKRKFQVAEGPCGGDGEPEGCLADVTVEGEGPAPKQFHCFKPM